MTATARRVDVQALRALAVAVVVLYHAFPDSLPGGYVGVDVFFVVSGYLITQQLLRIERPTRAAVAGFYARRLRRIIPAAMVVLVATLLLSSYKLSPLALPAIGDQARAVALGYPNIHFAQQGIPYLADLTPSPLLHYWSLGTEEQFYVVWPFLVFLAVAIVAGRFRLVILGIAGAASLVASITLSGPFDSWAFFGLHTRLWEFAAGGLIAVGEPRIRGVLRPALGMTLTLAGIAAIVLAAEVFGPDTVFPGSAALLPVSGAALVIAGGLASTRLADRVLGFAPLQGLGDISYSLYLWHWPLLVLFADPSSTDGRRWALIAAAVVLAAATYFLVETPARRARVLTRPQWRSFAVAGGLTLVGLGAAAVASQTPRLDAGKIAGPPDGPSAATAPDPGYVPSNLMPSLADAELDVPNVFSRCLPLFATTEPDPCRFGHAPPGRTMVLYGDSHAAQWAAALEPIAARRGWALDVFTKASCPAGNFPVYLAAYRREYRECDVWRRRALHEIGKIDPAQIVVASARSYAPYGVAPAAIRGTVGRGIASTLSRLGTIGRVLLIADTPQFTQSPALCLSDHLDDTAACSAPAATAADPSFTALERNAALRAGVRFIGFNRIICPDGTCDPIHGNLMIYENANHLTATFIRALEPRLARALDLSR